MSIALLLGAVLATGALVGLALAAASIANSILEADEG